MGAVRVEIGVRVRAAFAVGTAVVAMGCAAKPHVACTAALARPSLLVDLRAFIAAHEDVSGTLCPFRASDPGNAPSCAVFSVGAGGLLTSSSQFVDQGDRSGVLRIYLTPGDDRLTVHLHARDVGAAGGTARLVGHRGPGPCAGVLYSAVRVAADGTPSTQ